MLAEHLKLIIEHPDEATAAINQLVNPDMRSKNWYPTPKTCSDTDELNQIERRVFDEIVAQRELEKLDPTHSHDERVKLLRKFKWDDSPLSFCLKQLR